MNIEDRKKRILAAIVEEYIRTGEPVGSKTLLKISDLNVSSATIRNDMSELFDEGFLEQPYTSSGRIPSHLGYRKYIDSLMCCKPLSAEEKAEIDALFNVRDPDPDKLMEDAANVLSEYTKCAAIVASTTPKTVSVKKIDLVPVDSRTVVLILLASNGVIKNKVCRTNFLLTPDIADFFRKFATDRFCGRTLDEISTLYVNSVTVSLGEYSRLFNPLILSIYELCREVWAGQFFVDGETNLLSYGEFEKIAHDLLSFISNKADMSSLLNSKTSGAEVKIGKENSNYELFGASIVFAGYNVGKENGGTVGVIGPVRLNYRTLIPHIEYFANTLGKLLSETLQQNE